MTVVAASTLTTWRENVREQLQTELQKTYGNGFEVVSAQLIGPFDEKDVGCIWIADARIEPDTAQQLINVRVRVFRQWAAVEPYGKDPAELEEIPDLINNALVAIQVSAGLWWFSIAEFEIDHESWGTEVGILARRENPFLT